MGVDIVNDEKSNYKRWISILINTNKMYQELLDKLRLKFKPRVSILRKNYII